MPAPPSAEALSCMVSAPLLSDGLGATAASTGCSDTGASSQTEW